jgi:Tol biopolymer transport system component
MLAKTVRSILLVLVSSAAAAGPPREPVLKQIAVPHPYYYREMYLPQLTSGPSSLAWTPDGRAIVFSMAGSLWRQELESDVAVELTSGPGYDYEPDVSPDGRTAVYVKYDADAMELFLLDLASGASRPLTQGGQVNLEPRFSPDGKRLVFVSTALNGRFHVFGMDVASGQTERWTGENRSTLPRYYYSPFDHELSPAWFPDGSEVLYVSNRGHVHGTGGFFRMKASSGEEGREIHYEETNWKARPEISPDGNRMVYASYLGRQWHQLWTMPATGGDPLPLTYGEHDNVAPRWSPDGSRIAFLSNRGGSTSLWIQEVVGGRSFRLHAGERHYRRPMGRLRISVASPSRVSVEGADNRSYAPDDAWIHADDSFVRSERRFEKHYFHARGDFEVVVPQGKVTVEVSRGLEARPEKRTVEVGSAPLSISFRLSPLDPLPSVRGERWSSGDLHVHMNYGGAYRNDPARLKAQAESEDLDVVHNLIVNKEQRVPDVSYFEGEPDAVSSADFLLFHSQEFHTSYWGHLGLLGLTRNLLIPDYAAYPNTSAKSLYPTNAVISDLARAQGGLVGYVHPYEAPPDPANDPSLTSALVVDVALGKVDYLEVIGFSDHRTTAAVWYRFLNSGFRLPAGAGTDAMANFASLRGPVGLNRVYVPEPDSALSFPRWLETLRRGRSFVTNGPLVWLTVGGKSPGEVLDVPSEGTEVEIEASLRSIVPVDHLELVCNGEVVRAIELAEPRDRADSKGTLPIRKPGWCVLRAWNEGPSEWVLDAYPYATTSPIYVTVAGQEPRSPEDDRYFLQWIDRIRESVEQHRDWNSPSERSDVLEMLERARALYVGHGRIGRLHPKTHGGVSWPVVP